jgi:hypothetical protein
MNETPATEEQPTTEPPSENPDENTAPPSNPEPDPDQVEREEQDAERTIAT